MHGRAARWFGLVLLASMAVRAATGDGSPAAAGAPFDGPRDDAPRQCRSPRPVTPLETGYFTDVSDASGIREQNFDPDPPENMVINDHSRLGFGDIDGDGYDDIVAHNLFPNPRRGIPFEHLVFRNNRDGTFSNVSDASGLRDLQAGFFLFGDVDNDGDQDVFAGLDDPIPSAASPSPSNRHTLLLNDGQGHFAPKLDSGVNVAFQDASGNVLHLTGNAVFADFDGDANLDLFLGNGQTSYLAPDQIFMGNGDGTFVHASERLQGPLIQRPSNGSVHCDYDNDGDQDIFVSNYGISQALGHDVLWENDGRGRFTNVAEARGFHALATGNYLLSQTGFGRTAEPGKTAAQWVGGNGFGLQCEDANNDGRMDIFITNISHPEAQDYARTWSDPSALLINLGPERGWAFENQWLDRELPFNEGDVDGGMADFDNDGRMDLSISRDRKYETNSDGSPRYTTADQLGWFGLMHQEAGGGFAGVGLASGINDTVNTPPELLRMKGAQNHAWSDIDRDGDLDLLVGGRAGGRAGRPNFLFRNDIGSRNDWLAVRLVGDGDKVNRDAIGGRVALVYGDRTLLREVKSSRGTYNSMDTRVLHFGLGDLGCDFVMRVTWPDGTTVDVPGAAIPRNTHLTMRYGAAAPEAVATAPTASPTATGAVTPTPTPPGTLTLTGRVTSAVTGQPIAGATVAAQVCQPHQPFQAQTGPDGRYQLLVPEPYPISCQSFTLSARAAGYLTVERVMAVADLLRQPEQSFALPHDDAGTATPTATAAPGGDVTVTGLVYDARQGTTRPLAGATVAIGVCVPHQPFQSTSGLDGRYAVLLPADYANACAAVTLSARAVGYAPYERSIAVADLRANPARDIALVPVDAATPSATPTGSPRYHTFLPTLARHHPGP